MSYVQKGHVRGVAQAQREGLELGLVQHSLAAGPAATGALSQQLPAKTVKSHIGITLLSNV